MRKFIGKPSSSFQFLVHTARGHVRKASFNRKENMFERELEDLKKFEALVSRSIPSHPVYEQKKGDRSVVEMELQLEEAKKRIKKLEEGLGLQEAGRQRPSKRFVSKTSKGESRRTSSSSFSSSSSSSCLLPRSRVCVGDITKKTRNAASNVHYGIAGMQSPASAKGSRYVNREAYSKISEVQHGDKIQKRGRGIGQPLRDKCRVESIKNGSSILSFRGYSDVLDFSTVGQTGADFCGQKVSDEATGLGRHVGKTSALQEDNFGSGNVGEHFVTETKDLATQVACQGDDIEISGSLMQTIHSPSDHPTLKDADNVSETSNKECREGGELKGIIGANNRATSEVLESEDSPRDNKYQTSALVLKQFKAVTQKNLSGKRKSFKEECDRFRHQMKILKERVSDKKKTTDYSCQIGGHVKTKGAKDKLDKALRCKKTLEDWEIGRQQETEGAVMSSFDKVSETNPLFEEESILEVTEIEENPTAKGSQSHHMAMTPSPVGHKTSPSALHSPSLAGQEPSPDSAQLIDSLFVCAIDEHAPKSSHAQLACANLSPEHGNVRQKIRGPSAYPFPSLTSNPSSKDSSPIGYSLFQENVKENASQDSTRSVAIDSNSYVENSLVAVSAQQLQEKENNDSGSVLCLGDDSKLCGVSHDLKEQYRNMVSNAQPLGRSPISYISSSPVNFRDDAQGRLPSLAKLIWTESHEPQVDSFPFQIHHPLTKLIEIPDELEIGQISSHEEIDKLPQCAMEATSKHAESLNSLKAVEEHKNERKISVHELEKCFSQLEKCLGCLKDQTKEELFTMKQSLNDEMQKIKEHIHIALHNASQSEGQSKGWKNRVSDLENSFESLREQTKGEYLSMQKALNDEVQKIKQQIFLDGKTRLEEQNIDWNNRVNGLENGLDWLKDQTKEEILSMKKTLNDEVQKVKSQITFGSDVRRKEANAELKECLEILGYFKKHVEPFMKETKQTLRSFDKGLLQIACQESKNYVEALGSEITSGFETLREEVSSKFTDMAADAENWRKSQLQHVEIIMEDRMQRVEVLIEERIGKWFRNNIDMLEEGKEEALSKVRNELANVWAEVHAFANNREDTCKKIQDLNRTIENTWSNVRKEHESLGRENYSLKLELEAVKRVEAKAESSRREYTEKIAELWQVCTSLQKNDVNMKDQIEDLKKLESSLRSDLQYLKESMAKLEEEENLRMGHYQAGSEELERLKNIVIAEGAKEKTLIMERVENLSKLYLGGLENLKMDVLKVKKNCQENSEDIRCKFKEVQKEEILGAFEERMRYLESKQNLIQAFEENVMKLETVLEMTENERKKADKSASKAEALAFKAQAACRSVEEADNRMESLRLDSKEMLVAAIESRKDCDDLQKKLNQEVVKISSMLSEIEEKKESASLAVSKAAASALKAEKELTEIKKAKSKVHHYGNELQAIVNKAQKLQEDMPHDTVGGNAHAGLQNQITIIENELSTLTKTVTQLSSLVSSSEASHDSLLLEQCRAMNKEIGHLDCEMEKITQRFNEVAASNSQAEEKLQTRYNMIEEKGVSLRHAVNTLEKKLHETGSLQQGILTKVSDMSKRMRKLEGIQARVTESIEEVKVNTNSIQSSAATVLPAYEVAANVVKEIEVRVGKVEEWITQEEKAKQGVTSTIEPNERSKQVVIQFEQAQANMAELSEGDKMLVGRVNDLESQLEHVASATFSNLCVLDSKVEHCRLGVQSALEGAAVAESKCGALGAEIVKVFRMITNKGGDSSETSSRQWHGGGETGRCGKGKVSNLACPCKLSDSETLKMFETDPKHGLDVETTQKSGSYCNPSALEIPKVDYRDKLYQSSQEMCQQTIDMLKSKTERLRPETSYVQDMDISVPLKECAFHEEFIDDGRIEDQNNWKERQDQVMNMLHLRQEDFSNRKLPFTHEKVGNAKLLFRKNNFTHCNSKNSQGIRFEAGRIQVNVCRRMGAAHGGGHRSRLPTTAKA